MGKTLLATLVALTAAAPGLAQPTPHAVDRAITLAQAEAREAAMFARMDVDRDGYVTRDELSASSGAGTRSGTPPQTDAERRFGRPGEPESSPRGQALATMAFATADADRDGRVSRDEARAATRIAFDRADTDHDGRITPEERRAAWSQLRAMVPPPPLARP